MELNAFIERLREQITAGCTAARCVPYGKIDVRVQLTSDMKVATKSQDAACELSLVVWMNG